MYYYNPYIMMYPITTNSTATKGLFKGLVGRGINWSSILSGTGKTLNIINQTIPVIKEISPVMKNAKTMFRVMNEFKKLDTPNNQITNNPKPQIENNEIPITVEKEPTNNNSIKQYGPTFFI